MKKLLTDEQVLEIREAYTGRFARGEAAAFAAKFGVRQTVITFAATGRTYQYLPMKKPLTLHFSNGRAPVTVSVVTHATSYDNLVTAALKAPQLLGTDRLTVCAVKSGSTLIPRPAHGRR